jgi:hypothetical protein
VPCGWLWVYVFIGVFWAGFGLFWGAVMHVPKLGHGRVVLGSNLVQMRWGLFCCLRNDIMECVISLFEGYCVSVGVLGWF